MTVAYQLAAKTPGLLDALPAAEVEERGTEVLTHPGDGILVEANDVVLPALERTSNRDRIVRRSMKVENASDVQLVVGHRGLQLGRRPLMGRVPPDPAGREIPPVTTDLVSQPCRRRVVTGATTRRRHRYPFRPIGDLSPEPWRPGPEEGVILGGESSKNDPCREET